MDTGSADLRQVFRLSGRYFADSPLYSHLCDVVAEDPRLLRLVSERRRGQQPPNILFAAAHLLVRREPRTELAHWYASVVDEPLPPDTVDAAFTDFCLARAADLREIVRTRLVQTNVVRRSVALRVGLAAVAERCDLPITLIEVGSSAGIHLRHGAYGYVHNRRRWGDTTSPVQLDVGWRGSGHLPDLDRVPVQHSVLGIDLNPIDPTDAHEREWLRALVWPEKGHEEALLETALRIVASDPPRQLPVTRVTCCPASDRSWGRTPRRSSSTRQPARTSSRPTATASTPRSRVSPTGGD